MKKFLSYVVALISGIIICLLCRPTLIAKRGNNNVGGECLIPFVTVMETLVFNHREELFSITTEEEEK